MLRNTLSFLLVVLFSLSSLAQSEDDFIDDKNLNVKFLEHLIKVKVDSVRAVYKCVPLVNDSLLYVASKHHANYMLKKRMLTHNENEHPETKTPQLRAEHYGAVNYGVGENVLKTPFNVIVTSKKGKRFDTRTYGVLAKSIVNGWVNSSGHFKNIITPDYQITGVSIAYEPEEQLLYACQKFATVLYKYSFVESASMFPYSGFVPEAPQDDFASVDNELLNHKHEWKVKHGSPEGCIGADIQAPGLTVRFENNAFILRVENSNYVKELIQNPKDGFAIEIVTYDDYACGNPAYYTRPSRRNGQCQLNGRLLEPVYRKALFKGYKRRKLKKKIKYLDYIKKEKSVPFFKRFYRYKVDSFDSEYFEIKLARLPKDINAFWNHNLVYLRDNKVCNVSYFTGYCGELFMDSTAMKPLVLDTSGSYEFKLDTVRLSFEVPFEKNQANYAQNDIAPFVSSLSNLDYTLDSIHIFASSSVEGDSANNERLQRQRSESIVNLFQQLQPTSIDTRIETTTDWQHFNAAIAKYPKWNHLDKLNRSQLGARFSNGLADSLEFVLSEERKAEIELFGRIELTNANLEYYINKTYDQYCDSLTKSKDNNPANRRYLAELHKIYKYCYKMTVRGVLNPSVLASLRIPDYYNANPRFCEKFILYGYEFPIEFAENKVWVEYREKLIQAVIGNESVAPTVFFVIAHTNEQVEEMLAQENVNGEEVQALLDLLKPLSNQYRVRPDIAERIDEVYFNLNMLLLNKAFANNPTERSADAYKSLTSILSFYTNREMMTDSLALKVAKLAVHFQNTPVAVIALAPYMDQDFIRAYALPLGYQHSTTAGSEAFYRQLIDLAAEMDKDTWCNMFLNECTIPFQAFDDENLRKVFCEECIERNDFLNSAFE